MTSFLFLFIYLFGEKDAPQEKMRKVRKMVRKMAIKDGGSTPKLQ